MIRRIYQHAFAEGWLVPGDTVVDCFGGIAGTALDAMWNGCHWIGCELEPRFVGLAQQNIDLWQRKYGSKPGFGSARILQGDSRRLSEVIAGADLVCSSPPFHDSLSNKPSAQILAGSGGRMGESCKSDDVYGQSPGQLGAMKEGEAPTVDLVCSSPPYAAIATGAGGLNTKPGKDGQQSGRNPNSASQDTDQRYGESAGQLATMPEGDAPAVDCVVSSPPFATGDSAGPESLGRRTDGAAKRMNVAQGWGTGGQISKGSLGSMPEGRFDAVVSSPPYEGLDLGGGGGILARDDAMRKTHGMTVEDGNYTSNKANGNIGNQSGDTFWQAAREIVVQCQAILRPGGHSIWITKRFIRQGEIVEFSDQWLALCRSVGFDLVCRHRAMLVANYGEQDDIFGGTKELKTERKSFFRRLHEKRPGAKKIDWEDVLCLVKK